MIEIIKKYGVMMCDVERRNLFVWVGDNVNDIPKKRQIIDDIVTLQALINILDSDLDAETKVKECKEAIEVLNNDNH